VKLCDECWGKRGRWVGGRCVCDGWCHTQEECRRRSYKKCRSCRGKGFKGKVTVKCPTCRAAPGRKCRIGVSSEVVGNMHASRAEAALAAAQHAWEITRREQDIADKLLEIENLRYEIEQLKGEVEELKT